MKHRITIFIVSMATALGSLYLPVKAEEDVAAQLDKRVASYSKEYPVNLTSDESQLLKENCLVIQQKLIKTRDNIDETIVSREASYGYIERRLSSIQSRLTTQGIDTSIIDLMLASYRVEVNNFKNSAEAYRLTISDAIVLDCINKPGEFKSTILTARSNRLLTVKAMQSIRELYTSSITNGFKLLETQIYGKE
jgi:hypothetical protein